MVYKLEPSLWLKQMKGRQVEDNMIMLPLTLNWQYPFDFSNLLFETVNLRWKILYPKETTRMKQVTKASNFLFVVQW